MWKKILTTGLVLVMVLSLTACGEARLPSAQEIIDGVIESLDEIRTYHFDTGFNLEMAGEAEVVEMSIAVGFSGVIDLENKEMSADVTMSASELWGGYTTKQLRFSRTKGYVLLTFDDRCIIRIAKKTWI
ncbi:hypothetical protein ACFLUS_05810 [Chloroflexota bacterium]